jgi:DUF1365 family protein
MNACLYRGIVTHRRLGKIGHRLAYRVFMLLLDLDELSDLDRGGWWFGYNRRAVFSFHDADHGARDQAVPLRDWVRQRLAEAGIDCAGGSVRILCFPRVLGYAFNPLAVLFCHDRQGGLRAVLYEVSNTFGQQHGYLFAVPDPAPPVLVQQCDKSFYVSPFLGMAARYTFRLSPPAEDFRLTIRHEGQEGDTLLAHWSGQRRDWSRAALQACFLRYPLLGLKIIVGIHWHGLRIFIKGGPFHRRPPLPSARVGLEIMQTPIVEE